jgi:calcineurin-like phosphoesterase family protein
LFAWRDAPRGGYDGDMALYFTSDQHFGHANIIGYCHRPFADVDRMREWFVDLWNWVVEPDDVVWVLGDVALGRLEETLPIVSALKGHKVLVPGNHDRCWRGHRKPSKRQAYLDAGFEEILDGDQVLTIGGQQVLVSHFPYRGTGDQEGLDERYREFKPVDEGAWLLHGHVHDRWRIRRRQLNVGVDAWAGHLVSEATVERYITDPEPYDRDPDPWPRSAHLAGDELVAYEAKVRSAVRRSFRLV